MGNGALNEYRICLEPDPPNAATSSEGKRYASWKSTPGIATPVKPAPRGIPSTLSFGGWTLVNVMRSHVLDPGGTVTLFTPG